MWGKGEGSERLKKGKKGSFSLPPYKKKNRFTKGKEKEKPSFII